MAGEVIPFPTRGGEPTDDEIMCTISVNGKGDVELVVNAWAIETAEQHNWLVAKIAEASARVIDRKQEVCL